MSKIPKIHARLARQLRSRGVDGSKNVAKGLLKKQGLMTSEGKLTAKGRVRNEMTAGERSNSRAAKYSGGNKRDYVYNPATNRSRKKA